jgi:hypothetical protein
MSQPELTSSQMSSANDTDRILKILSAVVNWMDEDD